MPGGAARGAAEMHLTRLAGGRASCGEQQAGLGCNLQKTVQGHHVVCGVMPGGEPSYAGICANRVQHGSYIHATVHCIRATDPLLRGDQERVQSKALVWGAQYCQLTACPCAE